MRSLKAALLVTTLNCMLCATSFATSIVYVKYAGGYAVGSDSLRTFPDSSHTEHHCKLRVHNGIVLATHGSAGTDDPATDLRQLSDEVLFKGIGNADERSRFLKQELSSDSVFLKRLASVNPPTAGWVFIDNSHATEVSINTKSTVVLLRKSLPADALGFNQQALPYLIPKVLAHKGPLTREEALALVRTTLKVAAKGDSKYVGPPFSLLTVDSKGVRWVDTGGLCDGSTK